MAKPPHAKAPPTQRAPALRAPAGAIRLKYVTRRRGPKGRVYWYWQRKGFALERLPDDETLRFARARELNAWAEGRLSARPKVEPAPDAVVLLVRRYEATDRYKALAPGTRTYYDRQLRLILKLWGDLPVGQVSRRAVVDVVELLPAGEKRKFAAVLSNLFRLAAYLGWGAGANHARELEIATRRRDDIWDPADFAAYDAAAGGHPHARNVRLYRAVLRYSVQRPGDVAAMAEGRLFLRADGSWRIKLRQAKTRRLVDLPAHRDLVAIVEEIRAGDRAAGLPAPLPATPLFRRRPDEPEPAKLVTAHNLWSWSREVRRAAGLERLQDRDLRRSGMVAMAEAGCTDIQIAAVSGHTIEQTRSILETYIPRTAAMADAAILRWEGGE
ncbi:MAG: hypothetical protein WD341_06280 [Tistlia sp.]|uniref:hypothetical protein n=1 Tax=Tistlia sp. TaxID=3057121 RepID=UPI0034A0FE4D